MSNRRKIKIERLIIAVIILMLICFICGLVIDFIKYPEQYLPTWKYQLENDVKNGNTRAIEYYTTNYIENDKKLFESEILNDLGTFEITAYCSCEKCCGKNNGITKSGTKAAAGRTIAVDANIIPLGTTVIIDGIEYIAEDIGGAIKGNKIDIYFDTHEQALNFGVQHKNVYVY